jgi:hypothetical protein
LTSHGHLHRQVLTASSPRTQGPMEFAQGRPNGSKTTKVVFEVGPYFQNRLNYVSACP